jgi:hypothetical protein
MSPTEKSVFIVAFALIAPAFAWLVICASLVIAKSTPASMPETRHFDASAD